MAQYAKTEIVEARQYDGPRIVVVSDKFGEQVAVKGDWLVGTERGQVHVMSAASFGEFSEYTPTAQDEALSSAQALIAELKGLNDSLTASATGIAQNLADAQAQIATLTEQITDQRATQEENSALAEQLAAEQAISADLQTQLDALLAIEKHRADAQDALEAAQAAVNSTLGK